MTTLEVIKMIAAMADETVYVDPAAEKPIKVKRYDKRTLEELASRMLTVLTAEIDTDLEKHKKKLEVKP